VEGIDVDRLSRHMAIGRSRRGLLGWLALLPPAAGGFAALFGTDDADAAGRRRRRKKRHKHGRGRHRPARKCKRKSPDKVCAGTCGIVRDNCKKKVDCGPCDCAVTGCGPCATCQADGTCAPLADGTCCPSGVCVDGACAAEATLELCEGRCGVDSAPATYQCPGGGSSVPCPDCATGCEANGCASGGSRLFTSEGESFYCVTSSVPVGTCNGCPADIPNPVICPPYCSTPGTLCEACPAGQGCLLTACLEICTGGLG
jgi:hypothetical protein